MTALRRIIVPLLATSALVFASCGDDSGDSSDSAGAATTEGAAASSGASGPSVVASTTWTGAFADLAGAGDVTVIAPTSVLHPPDYDPKPSDLAAAADADLVVYAEFESFATRLTEAAGGDVPTFAITLENTAATIESEVMRLAEELGTTDVARANLDELLPQLAELGADAATKIPADAPVIVSQVFMSYWADWAGLTSVGTFGPAPMSAGELADLMGMSPTLVFDNHHVPGGHAFEAEGTPRIELINYPGDDLDLLAVFQHNHDLIVSALQGEVVADENVEVPAGGGHGHGDAHGDAHGDSATTVAEHGHGDAHGDTATTMAEHGHGDAHGDTATTDTSGHGG